MARTSTRISFLSHSFGHVVQHSCNATLYGTPAATFDVLQQAQNNLTRVVCQRGGPTDARPLLRSLHWLPVKH